VKFSTPYQLVDDEECHELLICADCDTIATVKLHDSAPTRGCAVANGPNGINTALRETAAFIVRACNAHEELIAALESAVNDLEFRAVAANRARAIIAKARGES
jgi:hypothetical protein